MSRIRCMLLLLLTICGCSEPTSHAGSSASTKVSVAQLELALTRYIQATEDGDLEKLQEATSSFTFAELHNNLISLKRTLTSLDLRNMATGLPSAESWTLIDSDVNGETALLVYEKDEVAEENKDLATVFCVRLVHENSRWKIDAKTNIVRDRIDANGEHFKFHHDMLPQSCRADGRVLAGAELIPEPDYVGYLVVNQPNGFTSKVSVNGRPQSTAEAQSLSTLVRGGLMKGQNEVSIEIQGGNRSNDHFPTIKIATVAPGATERNFIFEYEFDCVPKEPVVLDFIAD